jgi:carbonic anhydrase
VHGLIYGLRDGRLRDLDCTIARGHMMKEAAE